MIDVKVIILIARKLGAKKYKIMGDWVMFNCPFAKVYHEKKSDRNPSFGINKHGYYNCFSCGNSGPIIKLPYELKRAYNQNYKWLEEILLSNSVVQFSLKENKVRHSVSYIPYELLELFEPFNSDWKYITTFMAEDWLLLKYKKGVIFPYITWDKQLLALKYREESSHRAFFIKYLDDLELPDNKPKEYGFWYGEHLLGQNNKREVYIVEGERDAILLHAKGYQVLSTYGSKITDNMIKRLIKFRNIDTVILFTDNDKAGNLLKEKLKKELKNVFLLKEIKNYEGCKDPAEIIEQSKLELVLNSEEII